MAKFQCFYGVVFIDQFICVLSYLCGQSITVVKADSQSKTTVGFCFYLLKSLLKITFLPLNCIFYDQTISFCLFVYSHLSNFSTIQQLSDWAAKLDICLALMAFSSEGSVHSCQLTQFHRVKPDFFLPETRFLFMSRRVIYFTRFFWYVPHLFKQGTRFVWSHLKERSLCPTSGFRLMT
jgi:hypothetical protein